MSQKARDTHGVTTVMTKFEWLLPNPLSITQNSSRDLCWYQHNSPLLKSSVGLILGCSLHTSSSLWRHRDYVIWEINNNRENPKFQFGFPYRMMANRISLAITMNFDGLSSLWLRNVCLGHSGREHRKLRESKRLTLKRWMMFFVLAAFFVSLLSSEI